VQIKPRKGLNMMAALAATAAKAANCSGVTGVHIVDDQAAQRLLEPWLGAEVKLAALPVPQLVIATIDSTAPPDFAALWAAIAADGHGAVLDHRCSLAGRHVAFFRAGGAWRAPPDTAGNRTLRRLHHAWGHGRSGSVTDLLHFVGFGSALHCRRVPLPFHSHRRETGGSGRDCHLARLSHLRLLVLGQPRRLKETQAAALFGHFLITPMGYACVALIAALVAALKAATSCMKVIVYLKDLDMRQAPSG
jgi:cell division transport system permease protein